MISSGVGLRTKRDLKYGKRYLPITSISQQIVLVKLTFFKNQLLLQHIFLSDNVAFLVLNSLYPQKGLCVAVIQ